MVFLAAVARPGAPESPARGQGNPAAKRRAPAPPSPEEITLRSRAIREAVEQCAALVEAGDHRRAVPMLADLRRALEKQAKGEDDLGRMAARELPRVDALVARVALDAKAPDKALDFIRPYVEPRDAYNLDHADCYLVAGDALLALGKPYDALVLFDWMAGKADGVPLVRAAEGCGRAFLARKEFQKAIECFRFAIGYAQQCAYDQGALIGRLKGLLRDAQRLAEMDLYGEDFVRYRDAEHLRRVQGNHAAAREVYLEIIQKWPETIYAEASRLYAAQCLVALGKTDEAKRELAAFRASDPYGLYRGEAVLEMGRIALEYDLAPQAARGCFLLLETWLREVQDKTLLNIEKLAVREAAEKLTTPPAKEKYTDFWGNVKKNAIRPGQLVNRKTCPWYLDDLKEQMAMYLGFLAFVEGKKDEALTWYAKILECDPATRRLDTAGEWNDYSRLKWGAEHGYLYAYPAELALFKDPRQRLSVLLCDFYYVTERWDKARNLARNILDGKYGWVSGPPHEYVQYIYAAGVFRTQGREKAVPEYLKVIGPASRGNFRSFTQQRAAYAAANLGRGSSDEKTRQRAGELLVRLVQSPQQTSETYKARIVLAQDLIREKHFAEGLQLLRTFPKDAGDYKALADYYLAEYAKEYKDQGKD
jgi:hypothetical protein